MLIGKHYKVVIVISIIIVIFLSNQSFSLTIQLKNGSYLTGEITSFDNNGFEFKSWYNNGTLRLNWYHLNKEEVYRLKNILSLSSLIGETDEIDAHRIYLKSGAIYDGVLIEKKESNIQIKTLSGIKNIDPNDMIRMDSLKINPLKIYSSQEWYLEKLKTFDLEKASDNFRLADYCNTYLKLYDKAKEHYYKASQLSAFYKEEAYKKISELSRVSSREKINELERIISSSNDLKSVEQAKNILAELKNNKDITEDTQTVKILNEFDAKIKEIEKSISSKSEKELNKKVFQQYYNVIKSQIKKICEQNMSYDDAVSYVNTMLLKQIITKLSKDNKMSEEEIANIIGDRSSTILEDLPRREVSYGDGSWIISSERPPTSPAMNPEEFAKYQKKIKAITDARNKAAEKKELITPDMWWANAGQSQKEKFIEALFVEKYLSVIEIKEKPCIICNGEGVVNKNICKQCWGSTVEITVVYK